jgi:hypothetical protein
MAVAATIANQLEMDRHDAVRQARGKQAVYLLKGVLPTVVSPGAIWAEVEPGFHIELETAIWVDVLPDKRRDGTPSATTSFIKRPACRGQAGCQGLPGIKCHLSS